MQVIETRAVGECTATLYRWNNKYLLKFEVDGLEQTYKVAELDVSGPDQVLNLLGHPGFMDGIMERFAEMNQDLYNALENW